MVATYVKPGELGLNPEKLTEMLTEDVYKRQIWLCPRNHVSDVQHLIYS